MTGVLKIYRGLPGSGKTTRAKNEGGRLVGRDHIRQLMGVTEGIGTPAQEAEVTKIQEQLIVSGLRAGQIVHVDDMNLKSDYVRRLVNIAWREGATYRIIDLTDEAIEVCMIRNIKRDRVVPAEVIENLYGRYIKGKPYPLPFEFTGAVVDKPSFGELYVPDDSLPKAFLVDIDGTIADHTGIRGHHEYHKVSLDKPKREVILVVQEMIHEYIPVFVSGRPDSCEDATREWIWDHVIDRGEEFDLIMRTTGDRRADYTVKRELFDKHIRSNYNVLMAFDDRNQVVDMYRSLGLTVFQVAEGNF